MRRILGFILPGALLFAASFAGAQQEVDPILEGRLLLSGEPADTGTVALHRFTPEEAGDVGSVSVDENGRFSFRLPNLPVPGSGEIFFASWRYDGVLYFGRMLTDPGQLDSIYTVEAFPREPAPSAGIRFPVAIRNVLVEEGPMGWQVTDYLDVRNPGSVTYVPEEDGEGVVWQYPLPPAALNPRLGGGDVSPVDVEFTDGRLVASNPLPPGERLYVVHYEIESLDFDLPLPGRTEVMEFLVREPAPAMRVEGLARQPPEEIEVGSTVLRWAGREMEDQTVRVRLGEEPETSVVVWLSIILALLLVAAGAWVVRRNPGRPVAAGAPGSASAGPGPGGRRRKDILLELAVLEEDFEKLDSPGSEAQERYRRRRAELLAELEGHGGSGAGR